MRACMEANTFVYASVYVCAMSILKVLLLLLLLP